MRSLHDVFLSLIFTVALVSQFVGCGVGRYEVGFTYGEGDKSYGGSFAFELDEEASAKSGAVVLKANPPHPRAPTRIRIAKASDVASVRS